MTEAVQVINQSPPLWSGPLSDVYEIKSGSALTINMFEDHTDCVISCASALDILYKLFVFLTKELFGKSNIQDKLHFPYPLSNRNFSPFRQGAIRHEDDPPRSLLPYALPNLEPGQLLGLREYRNDLIHNMSPSPIQARAYIGKGRSPEFPPDIQYAQMVIRDFNDSGSAITHQWFPSFFSKQTDAQVKTYRWIEETCLVVDQTMQWLIHHLHNKLGVPQHERKISAMMS
jgi:hypothetical protein